MHHAWLFTPVIEKRARACASGQAVNACKKHLLRPQSSFACLCASQPKGNKCTSTIALSCRAIGAATTVDTGHTSKANYVAERLGDEEVFLDTQGRLVSEFSIVVREALVEAAGPWLS